MCDFILFLKNKIRGNFELEYMCSGFTFVQDIFGPCSGKRGLNAVGKSIDPYQTAQSAQADIS